jgi:carotenoid phi-ring synthase / carotenoid chi-ring synthase
MPEEKSEKLPFLVVGAGPAGMAAALSLAKSGNKVVLAECSTELGGKVKTINDTTKEFEHGIHGWWPEYHNFDYLLTEIGVDPRDILELADGTHFMLENGDLRHIKPLKRPILSPLFLLVMGIKNPIASLRDFFSLFRFSIHLLAYKPKIDDADYIGWSFKQFLDYTCVSKHAQRLLFETFTRNFFYSDLEDVSAAAALSAIKFYLMPTYLSIFPRWLKGYSYEMIFKSIEGKILEYGGEIKTGTKVTKFELNDDESVNVYYQSDVPQSEPSLGVLLGSISRLEIDASLTGWSGFVGEEPVLISKLDVGNYQAMSRLCTHAGCHLEWKGELQEFHCPCHGGIFDSAGVPFFGPPKRPLRQYKVEVGPTNLDIVDLNTDRSMQVAGLLLATDIAAIQEIVSESNDVPDDFKHAIGHFDTRPVIVIRFWFNPSISSEDKPQSALTPFLPMVDVFFCLNKMLKGNHLPKEHIVEIQLAGFKSNYMELEDATLISLAMEDMRKISPDYTKENLLDTRVQRHKKVFSAFQSDVHVNLANNAIVKNVSVAGDWTHRENNSWFMERGISTGLAEAGKILEALEIEPPLNVLKPKKESWMLRMSSFMAFLMKTTIGRGFKLPHPVDENQANSHLRYNHLVAGVAASLLFLAELLPAFDRSLDALYKWAPGILIAVSLYYFTVVVPAVRIKHGSWIKSLRDKPTFFHRFLSFGGLAVGTTELLFNFGHLEGVVFFAAVPVGFIFFGMVFMSITWGGTPVIDRQNRNIGFAAMAAGVCLGLFRLVDTLGGMYFGYLACLLLVAYFFLTYMVPVAAAAAAEAGHDHGAATGGHDHGTANAGHDHEAVAPVFTPTEKKWMEHDRVDHVINGWFSLGLAFCYLMSLYNPEFAVLSKVWPIMFFLNNLYFFFHVEPWVKVSHGSWINSFANHHSIQHRAMTLGGLAVGVIEIGWAFGWWDADFLRVFFPLGMILFGVMFVRHHFGEEPLSDKQHRDIGALAVFAGGLILLERFFPGMEAFGYMWPLLLVGQGYIFISYMATTLHGGGGHSHSH